MKAIPEVDRKAYELAKSYLPSQKITGVTQALIEKYQNLSSLRPKPTSRNGSMNAFFDLLKMQV